MYLPILRKHSKKKRSAKEKKKDQRKTYLMMLMQFLPDYKSICCGYSFELHCNSNGYPQHMPL